MTSPIQPGANEASFIDQTGHPTSPSRTSEQGQMGASTVNQVSAQPVSILKVKEPTREQSDHFTNQLDDLALENHQKMIEVITSGTGGTINEPSLIGLYQKNSDLLSKFAANVKNLDPIARKELQSLSSRNAEAFNELMFDMSRKTEEGAAVMELMGITVPASKSNASSAVPNHTATCCDLVVDIKNFITRHTSPLPIATTPNHVVILPAIDTETETAPSTETLQQTHATQLSIIKKSPRSSDLVALGEAENASSESTHDLHSRALLLAQAEKNYNKMTALGTVGGTLSTATLFNFYNENLDLLSKFQREGLITDPSIEKELESLMLRNQEGLKQLQNTVTSKTEFRSDMIPRATTIKSTKIASTCYSLIGNVRDFIVAHTPSSSTTTIIPFSQHSSDRV